MEENPNVEGDLINLNTVEDTFKITETKGQKPGIRIGHRATALG